MLFETKSLCSSSSSSCPSLAALTTRSPQQPKDPPHSVAVVEAAASENEKVDNVETRLDRIIRPSSRSCPTSPRTNRGSRVSGEHQHQPVVKKEGSREVAAGLVW